MVKLRSRLRMKDLFEGAVITRRSSGSVHGLLCYEPHRNYVLGPRTSWGAYPIMDGTKQIGWMDGYDVEYFRFANGPW